MQLPLRRPLSAPYLLRAAHRASGGHVPSLLLTHMQERASRLRKELLRHAPTPEAAPYLAACVHETLRLWPVAAQGSMRTPLADIDLPNGTCIPRGSMCGSAGHTQSTPRVAVWMPCTLEQPGYLSHKTRGQKGTQFCPPVQAHLPPASDTFVLCHTGADPSYCCIRCRSQGA